MVAMVAGDSGSPTPYGGVTSSGGDSIVGPGGIIAAGRADIFRPGPALPVQKCRRWPKMVDFSDATPDRYSFLGEGPGSTVRSFM